MKNIFKKPMATRSRWINGTKLRRNIVKIADPILTVIPIIAIILLFALIYLYVRPIKTADIKVPVATDQASYAPGDQVSGIFFGDTYYIGEVRVLREVFCKDFKGIIEPPNGSKYGNFFSTQGKKRHLEGQSVMVGMLPKDIPVGANCVLQFTNVYEVQTVFGIRRIEYQYYTQNFSIVSVQRRQQLDCEASGRTDCDFTNQNSDDPVEPARSAVTPGTQSSPETQTTPIQPAQPAPTITNNSTTNNNPASPPAPSQAPAPRYVEQCTVDIIVKIGCHQVEVK